ncbi:MAG: biotin transporter BioY [Bacteroidetes bacterium]|nr:biotin transporter BioY [Bacteroidota bacterium]
MTTQTAWVVGMAVLTAIGAQIEIPHQPVPFTLQTLFVLLAGGLLGPRNGFLSMSAYLLAGLAGLPVFSQFGFGLVKILGPTGGYLLAFPVAAFVVGTLTARRTEIWWTAVSLFAGLLIIFTLGTAHLGMTYARSWSEAFSAGFLIFSWWDVAKLVAATSILAGLQRTSVE